MNAPGAPAGFWPRYLAWSLDAVLIAVATCLLGASHWRLLIAAAGRAWDALSQRVADAMAASALDDLAFGGFLGRLGADPQVHAAAAAATAALLSLVLGWLTIYAVLGFALEVACIAFTSWRATPGKRALGLYVAARDGGELGAGRAALRYLGGSLSWLSFNIGHLVAMAKPEHLALHDRLAGASVRSRGGAGLPPWGWAWLLLQLAAALAACVWLAWTLQASLDEALYAAL
ncbi:RDD family protein [Lysobacter enzymogenes]|uniref:RDD family protein n=1 Tax=Lysobacter enzymogenes TaxID=69 RepID=UPI00144105C9|nr:RDD family protein [Lysobacter enzymogenes]